MAFLHILPFFFGVVSIFMGLLFLSYFFVKKQNRADVFYITLLYFLGGLVTVFQGLSNITALNENLVLYHRLKIFFLLFNVSIINIFINRISELKLNKMVIVINALFISIAAFTLFTPYVLKDTVWVLRFEHINMIYRFARKNFLYSFFSILLFVSLFAHIIRHITLKRNKTFRQKTAIISIVLLTLSGFNDLGALYKIIKSILITEYIFFLIPAVYSSILIMEIIQNEESAIQLTRKLKREKANLEKQTNELILAKREIESLNNISLQISKSLDFNKVFDAIVEYLIDIFGFEGCSLYLCSIHEKTYSLEKYHVPDEIADYFTGKENKSYSLDKAYGWLPSCMLENETLFLTNIKEELVKNKSNVKLLNRLNIKTLLLTPILSEDEVIGAFSLTSHTKSIYLSASDVESIKRFVNQIAITIKNSKLYDEILRERMFSSNLIENSPFAVLVVDSNYNPIYTNPSCVKVLGYNKNQIINYDFFNSREVEESGLPELFNQSLSGRTFYKENVILHSAIKKKDLILNITFTPVFDKQGDIDVVLIMFYDNTEKAIAERTLNEDLMMAKHIQSNYITLDAKDIKELEYDVYFSPMMEVGGDLYSVYEMRKDYYRIFIADATGHGVQAALTTMIVKAEYDKVKTIHDKPNIILSTLNNFFLTNYIDLNVFFTCVIIDFDLKKNKIFYSSAGHPEQFLLTDNSLVPLQAGGRMVGILENIDYKLHTADFKVGDIAVFFTDGLFEVFNKKGEEFGETRLGRSIENASGNDIKILIKDIVNDIDDWRGNGSVNDDITLLAVKYK